MSVQALQADYTGVDRDRAELFHGNRLLYFGWDQHLMICAPIALPLPPDMLFRDLVEKVLPTTAYAAHPEWTLIDWSRLEWLSSGLPFEPDWNRSLAENGLGHKAALRIRTPGLTGIGGSGS